MMFRRIYKAQGKKGQNTAEYAILIALVVAAILAMQTYAQRTLQARVKGAADYMGNEISKEGGASFGNTKQYEPYYLDSNYTVSRNETDEVFMNNGTMGRNQISNRTRNGTQTTLAPQQ